MNKENIDPKELVDTVFNAVLDFHSGPSREEYLAFIRENGLPDPTKEDMNFERQKNEAFRILTASKRYVLETCHKKYGPKEK